MNDVDKRNLSKEELEALQFISRAQAMALQKQFLGKQLRFKGSTLVGAARNASTKWEKFKAGAGNLPSNADMADSVRKGASGISQGISTVHQGKGAAVTATKASMTGTFATIKKGVTDFCRELCPGLDPNQVFSALQLGSIEKFATDLAPFVGIISSGGKALVGWVGVARKVWESHTLEETRAAFAPGDPEAAFNAIVLLLDREIQSQTAKATAKTVGFTGKALGMFADGGAISGPVVGLLEVLAEIFQMVVEYVRDYKECKAGNDMLRVGALNLELFTVCPVLGCYFLVVQDHSTIINFAVGDYGTPNWMFDVERLVPRISLALEKSRYYIRASRLEMPGFEHAKAMMEQNYSAKSGFDKVTSAPGALKDKIADGISAWFEKPVKLPKVDKSRIVGFGSNSVG